MDKLLFKNIIYTFAAQVTSILASVCMSGIIPKTTTVVDFGYWQLFVLYSSFIGLLHFGMVDGIYLRFGGKRLSDIPANEIYSIFLYYAVFQTILFLGGVCIVTLFVQGNEQIVLLFVCLYIPIKNIYNFFSMTLLSTNNIICTSNCDILRKVSLIIMVITTVFIGKIPFFIIIGIYLVSEIIPFFLIVKPFMKEYCKPKLLSLKDTATNIFTYIKTGISLTVSNIVGNLILGTGRLFIKSKWDIITFGKVSLALSLAFFLTMIITQASLALFPFIRNASDERKKSIYRNLEKLLSILFYFIFILYYPLAYIIGLWLPEYSDSVSYLSILVVFCLYEGKMQLLYTTYFKCLNKQQELMCINIGTLAFSVVSTGASALCFSNLQMVLYSMVLCLVLRNVSSYIFINKALSIKGGHGNLLADISMSMAFVFMQNTLSWWGALTGISILVGISVRKNKSFIVQTIKSCRLK